MIKRGNRKSAECKESATTLIKNYTKQVEHDLILPITVKCLTRLKGASVIPVGVATQHSINNMGE